MPKYYVYAHSNKEYGVFYVGKGSGNRLKTTGNRSVFWKRIVKKHGYTPFVLCECMSEEESFTKEIEYIALYKSVGQCVANFTNGGDGVRVSKRWWGPKIAVKLKGITRPRGCESKSYKDFASRPELETDYITNGLSVVAIAEKYNVSITTAWYRLIELGIPIRDIKKRGKKITCTTDGKVHASITVAAKFYGIYRENIRKVLAGKYKTTGGLTFCYAEE